MAAETYGEAAATVAAQRQLAGQDACASLLSAQTSALSAEDFDTAARCRDAGAGLLGWWSGLEERAAAPQAAAPATPTPARRRRHPAPSTAALDPRGCLLQITAAHGRLQGRTALIPAMSDLRFRDLTAEQRAAAMLASLKTQPPVLELFIRTGAPPSALDSSVDSAEPPAAAAAVSATQFVTRPVLVVDPLREDGGSPFMPLAARDGEGGAGMSVQIMIDAPEVGDGTADGELPPSALEEAAEPPVPDDDILSVLQEQLAAAAAPPQKPPSDPANFAPATFSPPSPDVTFLIPGGSGGEPFVMGTQSVSGGVLAPAAKAADLPAFSRHPATLAWTGRHQFVFEFTVPPQPPPPSPPSADAAGPDGRPAPAPRPSPADISSLVAAKWAQVAAEVARVTERGKGAKGAEAAEAQKEELFTAIRAASEQTLAAHGMGLMGGRARIRVTLGINGSGAGGGADANSGVLVENKPPTPPPQPQPRRMRFTRIDASAAAGRSADPFHGLFVGQFGTCGAEAVQLRRGVWGDDTRDGPGADDYVTAVKLTGDTNVPAGSPSFRAKVSPSSRLPHEDAYPPQLGVVARYAGEGLAALPGFRQPQWVPGELLVLDEGVGEGSEMCGGARLAFLWEVPGRKRFLICFRRLQLPI